jgi:hypothetical protein
VTCPVCQGLGTNGQIEMGPALSVGSPVVLLRGTKSILATITAFKPSGIKLRNNGRFTVRLSDDSVESFSSEGMDILCLYHPCPKCRGGGEVEPTWLDLAILASPTRFLISGRGTCQAVERGGEWVKFLHPRIRSADLITLGKDVYSSYDIRTFDECYQSFTVKLVGDTDVSEFIPGVCDTHGWHEGPVCPDCVNPPPPTKDVLLEDVLLAFEHSRKERS